MKIILTVMVAALVATISTSAYAFPSIVGSLGTSTTATDIILFKCSTQAGITVATTTVRDYTSITATPPNISVQIGNANSTMTCTGATGWTALKTTTGEGTWSPRTTYMPVSQISPANYYCIKVTKATASTNRDDYQLNHQCEITPGAMVSIHLKHPVS
ncbi:MAG: hypothetical protein HOO93_13355 [Methyloglobulus sp.]|nr:hypothetical protein [Methyloglobulus sp.]